MVQSLSPESGAVYSVGAAARRAGINVNTLRAWENRYGIINPSRTDTGRRSYTHQQVMRLVKIAAMVNAGHSIGRIATFDNKGLAELERRAPSLETDHAARDAVARIQRAVNDKDTASISNMVNQAFLAFDPVQAIGEVLAPSMRWVGEQNTGGLHGIVQEHLLTVAVTTALNINTLLMAKTATRGPKVGFTTVPGDRHETGILMGSYLVAAKAMPFVVLGPDLPISETINLAHQMNLDVIMIGASYRPHDIVGVLRELDAGLPASCLRWVGGYALAGCNPQTISPRWEIIETYKQFWMRLSELGGVTTPGQRS